MGQALHRPAILPVPAWVLKRLPGGMGQELLLTSTRAVPQKLLESGFTFEQMDLQQTLNVSLNEKLS